jgi:predicted nuclease of predicted toxin-antitoxin system
MRILIDMNLTYRWVDCLRDAGHEAVHWSALGSPTAKDSEICERARKDGYVLLTNDLDFPQILAHTRQAAPSVILLRSDRLSRKLAAMRCSKRWSFVMPSWSEERWCLSIGRANLVPECYRFESAGGQTQSTLVPVSAPPRMPVACASTALKI